MAGQYVHDIVKNFEETETGLHLLNILLAEVALDPNFQDNDGNTPAHIAIMQLKPLFLQYLWIRGANMNIRNKDGISVLDLCLAWQTKQ
jgi:ankyrin repeat protein